MKKRGKILISLFIFLAITSCKKEIVLPDPTLEQLFDEWEWVSSSGGITGDVTTAATAGYTQRIEFKSNGAYKIYKNDKLQNKTFFSLTEGTSMLSNKKEFIIHYKDHQFPQTVSFRGPDTLSLRDECSDCYGHVYRRRD